MPEMVRGDPSSDGTGGGGAPVISLGSDASVTMHDEPEDEGEERAADPPLKKVAPLRARDGASSDGTGSSGAFEMTRGSGASVKARDEPDVEGEERAANPTLEEGASELARGDFEVVDLALLGVEARTTVAGGTGRLCEPDGEGAHN